jgi:hypothetical protein
MPPIRRISITRHATLIIVSTTLAFLYAISFRKTLLISGFGKDTLTFMRGEELPSPFLILKVSGSFDTREYLVRNYQTC